MKRYLLLFAFLLLGVSLAAPGTASAGFSCDYCHEYSGQAKGLKYKAETMAFGEKVTFSGKKSINGMIPLGLKAIEEPKEMPNAWLINVFDYDNPATGVLDRLEIYFGDAMIVAQNVPEYEVMGRFISNGKGQAGSTLMGGYVVLSGDVWLDWYYIDEITGLPYFYFGGTGTVLLFHGSMQYVSKVKAKDGMEKLVMKPSFMIANAAVVDIEYGEMLESTWRPASAEIKVPALKFVSNGLDED